MEIQQLRHLVAASEALSYSQAAKICFTSRQNVAHSIKSLENELGITLFVREGSKMVPTPDGKRIALGASDIITRVDNLSFAISDKTAQMPPVNLAMSTNLIAGLPTGSAELIAMHPQGVLLSELSCEKCYESVCAGSVDAALIMCMKQEFLKCNVFEIATSISYALVDESSPLARLSFVSIEDLAQYKLLLMSESDFQYSELFAGFKDRSMNNVSVSVIPSTSSMIYLVKRINAVSIVSDKFASNPPAGTVSIPILDQRFNWHFYLLYHANKVESRSALTLAQNIRQLFKEERGEDLTIAND